MKMIVFQLLNLRPGLSLSARVHPQPFFVVGCDVGFHGHPAGQELWGISQRFGQDAEPGEKLSDGGGLRLDVNRDGNAAWSFRVSSPVTGKERFMGLGPFGEVSRKAPPQPGLRSVRDMTQLKTATPGEPKPGRGIPCGRHSGNMRSASPSAAKRPEEKTEGTTSNGETVSRDYALPLQRKFQCSPLATASWFPDIQ